ncbi:MAG: hypothetical protein Q9159_004502 [Coniocarpon cinnabarinum]
MSFAVASASRKEGERSISEEYKEKIERTARDPALRDWPAERNAHRRDRSDILNGHAEDGSRRNLGRRGSGGEGDRTRVKLNRHRLVEGHNDEELTTPRRAGFPDKLNKPWFRNSDDPQRDSALDDRKPRNTLRDERGKDSRHESKPSWLDDPLQPEGEVEAQSQQDFAAWKEMMKRGHAANKSASETVTTDAPAKCRATDAIEDTKASPTFEQPLFGTWGQSTEENKKAEEQKKKAKQSKFARFFDTGASKPKEESISPDSPGLLEPTSPPPPQMSAAQVAHDTSDEDKKGFNNLMNLLRTKGSISQGQSESAFSPPPQTAPPHTKKFTPPNDENITGMDASNRPQDTQSALSNSPPNHRQPRNANTKPTADPNAEFFLNLMKHSQPRAPFREGQIYGQNYGQRRESNDIASIINSVSPHPPKQQAPPPGFSDNQRAFHQNQNLDVSERGSTSEKPPNDGYPPQHPLNPRLPPHEHRRLPSMPGFQFPPQPPDFGPPPPGIQHARPPSRDGIGPPPGFAMRPNAPPGFPQYALNGPPGGQLPPHMRGPPLQSPPMQFNGQPPPGLGHGPPPGIGPQPNGQRMPGGNMHVPPGFEMYGDPQRRPGAAPPPPQSSYAHYLKQGGGPAAY